MSTILRLAQNPGLQNSLPPLQTVGALPPINLILGASTSSVNFDAIPGGNNLRLNITTRLLGATGIGTVFLRINDNTGAVYDTINWIGLNPQTTGTVTGSSVFAATSGTIGVFPANSAITGACGHAVINLSGCRAPFFKNVVSQCSHISSGTDGRLAMSQITFRSTGTTLSQIKITSSDGDFATGSIFTLAPL